jgi:division protein CdvB (Snf7/Vps24/ESCRT-III family)
MHSIGELQSFMNGLFEMMMGKLEAYQFITPHIVFVCQKSQLLVEHLTENQNEIGGVHSQTVVKSVIAKVEALFQEAMDKVNLQIKGTVSELGAIIKHELKRAMGKEILQYMSPERRSAAFGANNQTTPHSNS